MEESPNQLIVESHYQSIESMRLLLYIFDVMYILALVLSIYFLRECQLFTSEVSSIQLTGINLLWISIVICISAIVVVGLMSLLTNYQRKQKMYFVSGSLALIALFFLAWTQYVIYKDAKQLRLDYNQDCPQQMKLTDQSWMSSSLSCEKYVKSDGAYTQQCRQDQLAQTWDLKDKSLLACLNMNCCDSLAYGYSKPYYRASYALFATLLTGFGLAACLFQISTIDTINFSHSKVRDHVFIAISLIIMTIGLFLSIKVYNISPTQQSAVIVTDQQNVIKIPQNNNPIVYPQNWQGVAGCQPLSKVYGRSFVYTECDSTAQTCSANDKAVRVSFFAQGAALLVTSYINSPNIMYIQPQYGQTLFPTFNPNKPNAGNQFLSVQGTFNEVGNFLNSNVQFCLNADQSAQQQSLTVDIFYLSMPKSASQSDHHQLNGNNRLLMHKEVQSETDQEQINLSFTPDQSNYLNSLKFVDLKIIVKPEVQTSSRIHAMIYFFTKMSDCGTINSIPNRILKTDDNGILDMFNVVPRQYYLGVKMEGHYMYCNTFNLVLDDKTKVFELSVDMIQKNKVRGQFTVVLQSLIQPIPQGKDSVTPAFRMNLGATFSTTEAQCQVGYFFGDVCGGMTFRSKGTSQAISINQLVPTIYLFFVQFLPSDQKLMEINFYKLQGNTLTSQQEAQIDNTYIWTQMQPTLIFYANEQESQIATYPIPQSQATAEKSEPNLTWLSLCVDGSVGDVTQVSPQQFWNYAAQLVHLNGTKEVKIVRTYFLYIQFAQLFIGRPDYNRSFLYTIFIMEIVNPIKFIKFFQHQLLY